MFSSDRYFQLMSYEQGHGMLLFRSAKRRRDALTNIDVLFTDVRVVELRAWTEGLSVEKVDAASVIDAPSHPTDLIETGNRVYALRGTGWQGFVVGGSMHTLEDDTEEWEPTKLIRPMPTR